MRDAERRQGDLERAERVAERERGEQSVRIPGETSGPSTPPWRSSPRQAREAGDAANASEPVAASVIPVTSAACGEATATRMPASSGPPMNTLSSTIASSASAVRTAAASREQAGPQRHAARPRAAGWPGRAPRRGGRGRRPARPPGPSPTSAAPPVAATAAAATITRVCPARSMIRPWTGEPMAAANAVGGAHGAGARERPGPVVHEQQRGQADHPERHPPDERGREQPRDVRGAQDAPEAVEHGRRA